MKLGGFALVLHSHMPFYRGAGMWPHGEENLHEVMAESYVPLLEALTDLHEAGIPAKVTLGITPVLAEQLADPLVAANFEKYLEREIAGAGDDVRRFEGGSNLHIRYLAHYYLDWYRRILHTFQMRFSRDIVGGFRRLEDAGVVEILTSAATHAYLPLLSRDSSIYAQLAIGKQTSARHFGREAKAIWLPECAYRPAHYEVASDGTPYKRPGIERWLEEKGLYLFFSETGAVEGSRFIGRARYGRPSHPAAEIYDQVGSELEQMRYEDTGFLREKRIVPYAGTRRVVDEGGTFEAYYVRDSDVAVIGRNRRLGEQVWAANYGYPGDAQYREFHRKDPEHGFQYWRITDQEVDLQLKQLYEPFHAGQRVLAHADHFTWLVENQLRDHAGSNEERTGIALAAYDTELFGHWWFEGVAWLKEVLHRLAYSANVDLCTASEWLERHPAQKVIDLPVSSWGHQSTHITWLNPETSWMWDQVHAAEKRMERLVALYPEASAATEAALNQAARELALLEASDWEFLYTTGQARQYASGRFTEHVDRFTELAKALEYAEGGGLEAAARLAEKFGRRDNLFPDIDYRLFASRQPD